MLNYVMTWMKCKLGEEKGQAMAEYGLIIVLIAIFLIGALVTMAGGLEEIFNKIGEGLGIS